jgi:hypothetical protein
MTWVTFPNQPGIIQGLCAVLHVTKIELRPATIWVLPCAIGEVPGTTSSGSGTQCVKCGPSTVSLWYDPGWDELFVEGRMVVNSSARVNAVCQICPSNAQCTGESGYAWAPCYEKIS